MTLTLSNTELKPLAVELMMYYIGNPSLELPMATVISGIPFDNKLYISMCLLIMSCNKIASYMLAT